MGAEMTKDEALRMALKSLEFYYDLWKEKVDAEAIAAIKEALAQTEREKTMPITDNNGKAIQPQYRVVEQRGNWFLLYDQHQVGNTVVHEFRIQKLKHNILLYAGITLEEAKKRFAEKVEADNE